MSKQSATVTIDVEGCKGCVLCVEVCPPHVLEMTETVNAKGYPFPRLLDGCTGCELCAKVCPDFVIDVYRGAPESAG
jgi:2-oxoglutarate ferredoxin oxidoreductase subunit delta